MRCLGSLVGPLVILSLGLGCGDNPPKMGDDEAAEAEGTHGPDESGDAQGSESASEATTTAESDSTQTSIADADTEATVTASDTEATATATTTDDGASTSDTSDTSDTSAGHTTGHEDDHGGDTTTGGDPLPVAVCSDACVDASECAQPLPYLDLDNWTCFESGCQWLGCHDGECDVGQTCHDSGVGVPTCVSECVAPADCDQGFEPYIASNYTCDAGACVFLGCAADSECSNFGPGFVCTQAMNPPTCVGSCAVPQDCASPLPAYNVDNWSCDGGACVWLGCKPGECGKTKTCSLFP